MRDARCERAEVGESRRPKQLLGSLLHALLQVGAVVPQPRGHRLDRAREHAKFICVGELQGGLQVAGLDLAHGGTEARDGLQDPSTEERRRGDHEDHRHDRDHEHDANEVF